MKLSACNLLKDKIIEVKITASITNESAEELQLATGKIA